MRDDVPEKAKRRNQQSPRIAGQIFTQLTIGGRIRYLREVREMKQVELAVKCGLTQAAISNLETDETRKPSAPTLLRIAAALEVSPDWILTGVGDPSQMPHVVAGAAERELIELFKSLDRRGQAALLAAARAMKD